MHRQDKRAKGVTEPEKRNFLKFCGKKLLGKINTDHLETLGWVQ